MINFLINLLLKLLGINNKFVKLWNSLPKEIRQQLEKIVDEAERTLFTKSEKIRAFKAKWDEIREKYPLIKILTDEQAMNFFRENLAAKYFKIDLSRE